MRFELNIAIGGQHYAKMVLPESYGEEIAAKHKAREIAKMFSTFEVTLTCWEERGRSIPLD